MLIHFEFIFKIRKIFSVYYRLDIPELLQFLHPAFGSRLKGQTPLFNQGLHNCETIQAGKLQQET